MVEDVCDTMVKIGADGVLFAKNSDRDANEAQVLTWARRSSYEEGASVRCTWIEIPQVAQSNAVVVSRPWWMWGAEMGANEHGVVIGNEAVFTTEPAGPPALLGMDLVRLALERASNRTEAVSAIVELLERHGQGGPCSYERPGFTYDNSFLIADPAGAIVLETAGRHWAVQEVRSGARSISNGLTIPDFSSRFSRPLRAKVSACAQRRARTEASCAVADGPLAMMSALRDHGEGRAPRWSIVNGTLRAPCVHAGGLVASSQTTASLVSDLRAAPRHWASATSSPCTSLFKPLHVDESCDELPSPSNVYDPAQTWWRHERLHRTLLRDYAGQIERFALERDAIEAAWMQHPPTWREALAQGEAFESRWIERLGANVHDRRPWWVRRTWRELDAKAKMPARR